MSDIENPAKAGLRRYSASIKEPTKEVLEYIRVNYRYLDGKIYGVHGKNIGFIQTFKTYKYMKLTVLGDSVKRSHVVWYLCRGFWPRSNIYHKNDDILDDNIENLRELNEGEARQYRDNSRMYKGLTISHCSDKPRRKPYRVSNYKHKVNLGYYAKVEDAKQSIDSWIEAGNKWW